MTVYGGPIVYLIGQMIILATILVWWDSGIIIHNPLSRGLQSNEDKESSELKEDELVAEQSRVKEPTNDDGLRVLHLNKTFRRSVAVQDITFGVKRGEIFALLGPNGAGKSTNIGMIRGELRPSKRGGGVMIEDVSIVKNPAAARQSLGVCPQFDATDQMTVLERLRFYARIQGVSDVEANVGEILRTVGLQAFQTRMANRLSGGSKRKLSLGIALMGNPSVLILDEPSSGMDVAAKRMMWKTLASVVVGRSILLTTHSMEEADAIGDRAGIMAKKMLALGTSADLRRKHGDLYHVHLMLTSAPYSTTEEIELIRTWLAQTFSSTTISDKKIFHRQIRFSFPATFFLSEKGQSNKVVEGTKIQDSQTQQGSSGTPSDGTAAGGIGALFVILERDKRALGCQYYSVSKTTFDDIFSRIVEKINIEEEDYKAQVGVSSSSSGERVRTWIERLLMQLGIRG